MSELSDNIHQMDLSEIYRMNYPNAKGYTFCKAANKGLSKIGKL